jgi:hypothetical protein
MSGPTTDNTGADFLNTVISAFMSGGQIAAEAAITALDPPLLANPIAQFLLAQGVGYLGSILSIAGQKFGDALVMDLQTGSEKSNVLTAATALAIAQASGNQTAIAAAVANADAAWKAVTNFDGWSTPK